MAVVNSSILIDGAHQPKTTLGGRMQLPSFTRAKALWCSRNTRRSSDHGKEKIMDLAEVPVRSWLL